MPHELLEFYKNTQEVRVSETEDLGRFAYWRLRAFICNRGLRPNLVLFTFASLLHLLSPQAPLFVIVMSLINIFRGSGKCRSRAGGLEEVAKTFPG